MSSLLLFPLVSYQICVLLAFGSFGPRVCCAFGPRVRACAYAYVCARICVRMCARTCVHACVRVCACARMRAYVRVRMCARTCVCGCVMRDACAQPLLCWGCARDVCASHVHMCASRVTCHACTHVCTCVGCAFGPWPLVIVLLASKNLELRGCFSSLSCELLRVVKRWIVPCPRFSLLWLLVGSCPRFCCFLWSI